MASGILGKANIPNAATTVVYTAPNTASLISVVNISIVNLDQNNSTNIILQVGNGNTIIESNTLLGPSEGIARACGVLGPNESIAVTSSSTSVAVVINGVEKIGYTGGTLSANTLNSGANQTYTAPDSTQCDYVIVDYNVVSITGNVADYTITIDNIAIESNSKLQSNTGVFRALGPISPSSVINVICNSGPIIFRISGRLY